jgi:hypothetical protein
VHAAKQRARDLTSHGKGVDDVAARARGGRGAVPAARSPRDSRKEGGAEGDLSR